MVLSRDVEEVVVGGTWLLLSNIVISVSNFLFWLIVSRIVGVDVVGVASATISAATIALTLSSAGLSLAVVREVSAQGSRAFMASIIIAAVSCLVATTLVYPLTVLLGYQELLWIAVLVAVTGIMNLVLQFSLVGFEEFKQYFIVSLTGSVAKLTTGSLLAILGYKTLAPLIGYLAYPLTASIISLAYLLPVVKRNYYGLEKRAVEEVGKLALSNYPYIFSNQLLTMLSIYVFTYIVQEPAATGTLYITFMITMALFTIPYSILTASLPIGTRRNTDPFRESLRIGLALATPIIVFVATASTTILSIINPDLAQGTYTLKILLLSITPQAVLATTIIKLNKEKKTKNIFYIGLGRLLALITILSILSTVLGINGAALAYLASTILLLPITRDKELLKTMTIPWSLQIISATASLYTPINNLLLATIATILSIAILHKTKTLTIQEVLKAIKLFKRTASSKNKRL